jgi:hypothetical protein
MDPSFESRILGVVHHWSTQPNHTPLRWTAAMAYGNICGVRHPKKAVADLRAIAEEGLGGGAQIVWESLVGLLQSGLEEPELALFVLNDMQDWAGQKDEDALFPLGLIEFVLVMQLFIRTNIGGENVETPLLVAVAQRDADCCRPIAVLISLAIRNMFTGEAAMSHLSRWVSAIKPESPAYSIIEAIIKEVAAPERGLRRRLQAQMRFWSQADRESCASSLSAALEGA